jgi:RNA polymerase sigma-70 factor (ECF subfamily)
VAEAAVPDTEVTSVAAFCGVPDSTASYIRFVESTKTTLYVYALYLTGNKHLAEDLIFDYYSKLWPGWDAFRTRIANETGEIPASYTKRAVYHAYLDFLKRPARRETSSDDLATVPHQRITDQGRSLEDDALHDQAVRELRAAIAQLDPVQQIIIHEIYVEGHRTPKVAKSLDLPESTVRYKHKKALESLRRLLGGR